MQWGQQTRLYWESHCSPTGNPIIATGLCKSPAAVFANDVCECDDGSDEPLRIDCVPDSLNLGHADSAPNENAVIRCPSASSRGLLERAELAAAHDQRFGSRSPWGEQMRHLLVSGIIPISLVGDSVCDCHECEDERDESLLRVVLGPL